MTLMNDPTPKTSITTSIDIAKKNYPKPQKSDGIVNAETRLNLINNELIISVHHSTTEIVTDSFFTILFLTQLKRFVAEYCGELGRPVQQVLERTEANVQWMERNYQTIVNWLLVADKDAPKAW